MNLDFTPMLLRMYEKKINCSQLAKIMKVDRTFIYGLKYGTKVVKLSFIEKLCEYFDCNIDGICRYVDLTEEPK